jgi:hypothetical protein
MVIALAAGLPMQISLDAMVLQRMITRLMPIHQAADCEVSTSMLCDADCIKRNSNIYKMSYTPITIRWAETPIRADFKDKRYVFRDIDSRQ